MGTSEGKSKEYRLPSIHKYLNFLTRSRKYTQCQDSRKWKQDLYHLAKTGSACTDWTRPMVGAMSAMSARNAGFQKLSKSETHSHSNAEKDSSWRRNQKRRSQAKRCWGSDQQNHFLTVSSTKLGLYNQTTSPSHQFNVCKCNATAEARRSDCKYHQLPFDRYRRNRKG